MQEMHREMRDIRNDCSNSCFIYPASLCASLASPISWICDTAAFNDSSNDRGEDYKDHLVITTQIKLFIWINNNKHC